jgi:inhibitor of cysteine peptidase
MNRSLRQRAFLERPWRDKIILNVGVMKGVVMKKRVFDIMKPGLPPLLVWGIICLHAGPLVAMPANDASRTTMEKTVAVQEASSNKSVPDKVEVVMGREFSLNLASNATTGYHWELAAPLDEALVKLVSSTYQAPRTGLLGAGGQEIWTFRAVGRGQTVIQLKYVRPWEKDATPAETASCTVVVR